MPAKRLCYSCYTLLLPCFIVAAWAAPPALTQAATDPAAAPGPADGPAANPHLQIMVYEGPQTCVTCHRTQAQDAFRGVHYQWTGATPHVPNIPGNAGKGQLGFNTYCGTPTSSPRFTCASACHVGYGGTPTPGMSPEQLHNIDCMMCHQAQYARKFAGPFEQQTYVDYLGIPHTWNMPVEDAQGNFALMPDEANMPLTILEAARTVHRPTRTTCLRCHAFAAGTDGGKRGDLSTANRNPGMLTDYHMSPQGRDMVCQNCHTFDGHRVAGRGLDLRPTDRPEQVRCTNCHPARPHNSMTRDNHAARVACQACHISHYAKDVGTEVERNWEEPFWAQGLFSGQGGFKAEEPRGSMLVPTYRWFGGMSYVYALGQVATQNSAGEYEFGAPIGSVSWPGAQLYPMKEHWSLSARHEATGQMIPHSTFKYFVTGDWTRAVEDGMAYAGLTGSWTTVRIHTYQTINHGVEPHDYALQCGDCHAEFSGGLPVRMDLVGELGFALKGSMQTVCTQCHSLEPSRGFEEDHEEHVREKGFDCAWCHTFSRQERNLRLPPNFVGDVNCDGLIDNEDIDPFVLALTHHLRYLEQWPLCDITRADVNRDGLVDNEDIDPFVALLTGP